MQHAFIHAATESLKMSQLSVKENQSTIVQFITIAKWTRFGKKWGMKYKAKEKISL